MADHRIIQTHFVSDITDHDIARMYANTDLYRLFVHLLSSCVHLNDRTLNIHRGRYCPVDIIRMRDRRAKYRHQSVAKELIDRALITENKIGHIGQNFIQERYHLFGTQALAERRESPYVGKKYRHRAPYAFQGLDILGRIFEYLFG